MAVTTTKDVDPIRIRTRRMLGKPVDAPRKRVRVWVRRNGLAKGAAHCRVVNDDVLGYWEDWVWEDDLPALHACVETMPDQVALVERSYVSARREAIARELGIAVDLVSENPDEWDTAMRTVDDKLGLPSVEGRFLQATLRPIRPFLKVEVVEDLPPLEEPKNKDIADLVNVFRGASLGGGDSSSEVAALKAEVAELKELVAQLADAKTAPRGKKG